MKKWIVPSLLALALCLCLLPTNAAAEGKPWETESGWTVLTADLLSSKSYKLDGGKYYLDKDVTITRAITTAGGAQEAVYITLDLNGHTLKQTEKTASVISPSGYVVLTIQDSAGKGTITSDADASSCPDVGGIYIGARPTVILKSGTISGCVGKKAGAVHVYGGGTFTMTGGTITGCKGVGGTGADYYPGGVYVDGGGSTFNMTGGTIEKCFSYDTAGGANLVVKTGSATIGGNATIGVGYGKNDNSEIYAVKLASGTLNLAGSAQIRSVHVSYGTLTGADNGTVTGDVLNNATISGGTFTGTVTNRGTIENAAVKTVTNYGEIKNSTLGSNSGTDDIINCGTITGGSTILGAIGDSHAISWEGGITDDCTVGSGTVAIRKMVRFDSKGGSAVDPVLCDADDKATKPADPTRDGWSLYGWFTDESCTQEFDFNTALTDDITLYAGWAKNISSQDELAKWDTYDYSGARYLRLTDGFDLKQTVIFTKSLTIDLNGKIIWCYNNAAIQVGKGEAGWSCTVTITDRSGQIRSDQLKWANVTQVTDKWALVTVKQGNTLCLQNGTLHAVAVDGSFQMSGGTVDGYGTTPAVTVSPSGSFQMSGGTVTNDSTTTSDGTSVQVEGGTFTLTGGTVKNTVKVSGTMNADGGTAAWAEIASGGKITQSSDASKTTEFTGTVTNSGTIEAGVYRGVVTGGTVTGGLFYNPDNRTGDILTRSNFNNSYRVSFQANGKPYAVAVVPSGSTAPELASLGADAYGRKWLGWFAGDSSTAFDFAAGITGDLTLTARWNTDEAETGATALTCGQTYYFDLSAYLAEGNGQLPGTVNAGDSAGNESLPDTTLHYVPFTYAGQVQTYALASASSNKVTTTRILFMADTNLVNTVSWDALNAAGYIYGKNYTANGVTYTLRAPTGGSTNGNGDTSATSAPGQPISNEWDTLLSKEKADNKDYIKLRATTAGRMMINWAITQDVTNGMGDDPYAVIRRDAPNPNHPVTEWDTYWYQNTGNINDNAHPVGYRPVLELNQTANAASTLAVVTLELNGGKLDGQETVKLVVKSGATYTAPSATGLTRPESSKDGTYFSWLDKSTGTLYAPGAAVPASVTTLTAQWVQTFTVSYTDGKDGEIFTAQSYSAQDGTNTPAFTGTDLDNVPSWTFTGWSPSVATTVTGNATYTAQWKTKNANTLVLDGNGGTRKSGKDESTTYTQQSRGLFCTLDSASENFKRKGYTLLGWQKRDDTDTTLYKKGDKVYFTAIHNGETITLYAQWKLETYTISFKYMEGATFPNGTVLPKEYTVLDSVTLPTPSKTGYTFGGWFLNEAFSGKAATSIPTGTTGNKTYRAKWTPFPYTITYNGMDGATNTNPATYTIESDTFTLSEPTCEGHAFLGWTGTDLTETTKTVTIEKGSTGSRSYTANWKQLYTVTFDPNGGTLAEAERTAQTDISDRLTLAALPVPTRGGYRFSGWYTAASGGEKVDLEKVYDGNTTLYAHWTRKSTTGGGTAAPEPVPDATGGTVTAPEADNGGVSVSDKNAAAGETVTVVVTPDAGYALGEITVVDQNGNKVDLVKRDDGSYDFVMPSGGVTVTTDFVPDTGFTDVPAGKYFTAPVAWAVEKGITGGTDAAHFSPYAVCTRGQLVTFLWRAAGRPATKTTVNPFADVRESSSFYPAILWAAENGIVGGYDDGSFRPNAPVTRQQVAAILYRYAKFAGMDTTQGGMLLREFSDCESVSAYALSAMGWAVNTGVLTGNSGALLPHDPCTRAQIVTMLYRLLGK